MRTTHIRKTVAMSGAMFIALLGATGSADAASPHQGKGSHETANHATEKTHQTEKAQKPQKVVKSHKIEKGGDSSHHTAAPKATHSSSHGSASHSHASSTHTTSSQSASSKGASSKGVSSKGASSKGATTHAKGGGKGDPAGNNGTVKVDDDPWFGPNGHGGSNPGNGVGNDPHLGCNFQVEWYGFDQGDDIISTVTFEMQSPTKDVILGGYTPTQVFVGEDPAGGGTDLDAKQTYTLSFDGAPHPKHGYHVKLTIHTPGSIGADTKHKVFWVEGCESTGGGDNGGGDECDEATEDCGEECVEGSEGNEDCGEECVEGSEGNEDCGEETPCVEGAEGTEDCDEDTPGTPETPGTSGNPGTPGTPEVLGEQGNGPNQGGQPGQSGQPEVLGQQAVANQAAQAAVPSAVNSGLVPVTTAVSTATDEWPLALGALGLSLLGAGLLTRRARS